MSGRIREETGVGLTEILVASLVLLVGISAVITVFISSGKAGSTAERHEVAINRAEAELEAIRALPYDQVKLTQAPPTTGEPGGRVAGASFRSMSDLSEPLVLPTDPELGVAAVAPYSTVVLGGMRMEIHRFVTWRDEECPGVGADLVRTMDEILASSNAVQTLLTGQVSITGQLRELKRDMASARTLNVDPTRLGRMNSTLAPLDASVDRVLTRLTGIVGPLERVASNAAGLRAKAAEIAATLDPCDLSSLDVRRLGQLRTIRGALARLQTALAAQKAVVTTLLGTLDTLLAANLLSLLGIFDWALGTLPAQVEATRSALAGTEATLDEIRGSASGVDILLSAWADDMAALVNGLWPVPDHVRNTKRITVAVIIDRGATPGPNRPVWASTVVTDPDAGLLG